MKGGPIKVNDLNIEEFKAKVINLLFKEMYNPNKKEINEDYIMIVKHGNTLDEFKTKVIDLLFKS